MERGENLRAAARELLPEIEAVRSMAALGVDSAHTAFEFMVYCNALSEAERIIKRELRKGECCELTKLGKAITDARTLVRELSQEMS